MPTEMRLLTVGLIASELGVSVRRVNSILAANSHIKVAARAGITRVYDGDGLAMVRHAINKADAQRCGLGLDAMT